MKCFKCNRCHKRFHSAASVDQHITDKHKGQGIAVFDRPRRDEEESYADRAIEASIAVACGEHTDDGWLLP